MAIETVAQIWGKARSMLRKVALDQWGILKKFVADEKNDPEFQISSFRFALRWHPDLIRRSDRLHLRSHYGRKLQHLAAAGHLLHNGIGDYRLSPQGWSALDEHLTAKRQYRHTMLASIIVAFAGVIAAFAAEIVNWLLR
jgi:hypothetical protein